MNHKLSYSTERYKPTKPDEPETTEWVQNTSIISDDPKVVAGTLRALADKLDPPKTVGY